MWDDLERRFKEILVPLFPKEAECTRVTAQGGLSFSVSWKLKNDSARPNKRSRLIILVIPEEFLEDYCDGSQHECGARETRITEYVRERLKQFNPDHTTPYGQPVPQEEWVLI